MGLFLPPSSVFSHLAEPPQPLTLNHSSNSLFPFPRRKKKQRGGQTLNFSFKKTLVGAQGRGERLGVKASDFSPPPKLFLHISSSGLWLFPSLRRDLETCHGGQDAALLWGSTQQRVKPMLPARLSEPFQLCSLTKSVVSLL